MSQRENAIGALFAVLGQLSLGTTVKRNAALPERIADHAMAILRDGEMGEPEVSLSPLTYHWQHQVAIELFVADPACPASPWKRVCRTFRPGSSPPASW